MGTRMKAVLDTSGIKALKRDLKELEASTVDFGYTTPSIHKPSGLTYGHLARILEWGIRGKIPARPALRDTTESLQVSTKRFELAIQQPLSMFLEGSSSALNSLLETSGSHLSSRYSQTMDNWLLNGSRKRDNADDTIDLKGFNKPFEESGELIANTDYKINR